MVTPSGSRPFSRMTSDDKDFPEQERSNSQWTSCGDSSAALGVNTVIDHSVSLTLDGHQQQQGKRSVNVTKQKRMPDMFTHDSSHLCRCNITNQSYVIKSTDSCQPCSSTHVVSINNESDDVAGVGGQRAHGRLGNEIFQLLKETNAGGEDRQEDWRKSRSAQTHSSPCRRAGIPPWQQRWSECCGHSVSEPNGRWRGSPIKGANNTKA